ncbi:hypothetical protein D3C84_1027530 [compost metagenome]
MPIRQVDEGPMQCAAQLLDDIRPAGNGFAGTRHVGRDIVVDMQQLELGAALRGQAGGSRDDPIVEA